MTILQREEGDDGSFYIGNPDDPLAEITYQLDKDRLVIHHTEVGESLRGRNIGYELVLRVVELARERRLRIVPICSYARKVLTTGEDFKDVL